MGITTTLVNTSTKLTSMKAVTVALVLTLALASNAFTLEIAENSDSQVRNSVVQQSRSSQSGESRLQTLFNTLYLDCHTKVVAAGLDDKRAIDFRPHCYH